AFVPSQVLSCPGVMRRPEQRGRNETTPQGLPAVGNEIEVERLSRELGEAYQRETATSEVLKVISASPGELEAVFNAMLANATRICEAKIGVLYLCDGEDLRFAATHGAPPAYVEARKQ